jgi:hypothetical protein
MALDVKATFVSLLDAASSPEEDASDDDTAVGPIAIALDMEDAANDVVNSGDTSPDAAS